MVYVLDSSISISFRSKVFDIYIYFFFFVLNFMGYDYERHVKNLSL